MFAIWTVVGLFEAAPEMLRGFHWNILVNKLVDAWTWILFTPAIVWVDRRFAANERKLGRLVLLFLLLSVPFSVVHAYVAGVVLYPIRQVPWSPLRDSSFLPFYILGAWQSYCAVVGILLALRFHNRYLAGELQLERVERSLTESRLNALRLHLEPHFLFNALNAITSEVAENPMLARDMIADLGALLRRSLDTKESAEISLAQELALLEHYLSIQRVRFGARIEIRIDVDPKLLSAEVPSMLLQPLVENAIRHGIEGRLSGGRIAVRARRTGDSLELLVIDDGPGMPRDWRMESSGGHGLRVTAERLTALYPQAGEECLTIGRSDGGGTEVTIRIPLENDRTEWKQELNRSGSS